MKRPGACRIAEVVRRRAAVIMAYGYADAASSPERHCILGWMAREADIPLPFWAVNTHLVGMSGTLEFACAIEAEYGLARDQLRELQLANDNARDADHFMESALTLLERWCDDGLAGSVAPNAAETARQPVPA